MTGIAAPNIPTYVDDASAVTARNAEYTGTPFTDTAGGARYANPYLGMNRAGANAPGIGIGTGIVSATAAVIAGWPATETDGPYPEKWTLKDQNGATGTVRESQLSGIIGHAGQVDRDGNVATTWDTTQALYTPEGAASSGGVSGVPTDTVRFVFSTPNASPAIDGTVDTNNLANLVITDAAAADGADMDVGGTGSLNKTGAAVAIGDMVWGMEAVA